MCITKYIQAFAFYQRYLKGVEKKNKLANPILSRGNFPAPCSTGINNLIPSYTLAFDTVSNYPQIYFTTTQFLLLIVYTTTTQNH